MIVEVRKKSQITIPKDIVEQLHLQEGDHLDVSVHQGMIQLKPVAIYSKSYVDKLEKTVLTIQENSIENFVGPFTSVDELRSYLNGDKLSNK
jgi:AbrB family looped-hinge helix DNA binding protein